MRLRVDTSQLNALTRDLGRGAVGLSARAEQAKRKVAFDAEREWKGAAPVDTGRYRASIGHYDASLLTKPNSEASEADAYYDEGAGFVELGTNVPYAAALADGHSTQMPAGTIDAVWLRGERALQGALDALVEQAGVGR